MSVSPEMQRMCNPELTNCGIYQLHITYCTFKMYLDLFAWDYLASEKSSGFFKHENGSLLGMQTVACTTGSIM